MSRKNFQIVERILKSDCHDLKSLAQLSGRSFFRFYNGANLSGLDLSDQDLRGLNFDGADIRFSTMKRIIFDDGAFNNAIVDKYQSFLKDEYYYNAGETLAFPSDQILLFARIRPQLVDKILALFGSNYQTFADFSKISVNALRKARNDKVISIETAQKIFRGILDERINFGDEIDSIVLSMIEQPCVMFLIGGNNEPFYPIQRDRIDKFINYKQVKLELSRIHNSPLTA